MADVDDIRERLELIAEELADLVLVGLQESIDAGRTDPAPLERRLARARRSVEKAAALLRAEDAPDDE